MLKHIILGLAIVSAWGCGNSKKESTVTAPATTTTTTPTTYTGNEAYNPNTIINGQYSNSNIANIVEIGNYQGDLNRREIKVVLDDNGQYFNYGGWVYSNPTSGYRYSFNNLENRKQPLNLVQGPRNGYMAVIEKQYNGTTDAYGRVNMFFKPNGSSTYQLGLAHPQLQGLANGFGDSYQNVCERLISYFVAGNTDLAGFKSRYYPNSNFQVPTNYGYNTGNNSVCYSYDYNCTQQNVNTVYNTANSLYNIWNAFSSLWR